MSKLTDYYQELRDLHDASSDEDIKALMVKTRNAVLKLNSMYMEAKDAALAAEADAAEAVALAQDKVDELAAELANERRKTPSYDELVLKTQELESQLNAATIKHTAEYRSTEYIISILLEVFPLLDSDDVMRITKKLENQ